jgi:hypothetical protein
MAAPISADGGHGVLGFLRETLGSLRKSRLLVPALLLTVLLTVSNIVILRNAPPQGEVPPLAFVIAAIVRVAGLLLLAVTILRVLTDSRRRLYMPDGAFWLYVLTGIAGFAVSAALGVVAGDRTDPIVGAVVGLATIAISAPFAAWFTAIAVERPLALNPAPWMRGMSRWLAPLLLWSVLVALPLGQLHAAIDYYLIRGAGDNFWPLMLFDGPLSAVLTIFTCALAVTAYRRVARG